MFTHSNVGYTQTQELPFDQSSRTHSQLRGAICPSEMSLNPHRPQEYCMCTRLWPLTSPTKAGKCKVALFPWWKSSPTTNTQKPSPDSLLHSSNIHQIYQIFDYLHDLWLFGAAGPEGEQADDKRDKDQYCHDCDYGDVAGVGQRGRVGSLSWNHIGQVQHVAQRPAGVAPFYLDTSTGRGKGWQCHSHKNCSLNVWGMEKHVNKQTKSTLWINMSDGGIQWETFTNFFPH